MKIRQWDETAEKFRKVTDKLGKPIDAGIFDTVMALNVLGVPTTMSCEGHLDHGLPYPWVDIGWPSPEFPVEIRLPGKVLSNKPPSPDMGKMQSLLDEFYCDRTVPPDRRIILGGLRRIYSRGGGDPRKLLEYQQEMREFTEFLRALTSGY